MPPNIPGILPAWIRILNHLDAHGAKTGKQLKDELNLARRTVYGAIKTLLSGGWIHARPSLRDARQTIYTPKVNASRYYD
jgi:DNA-binding MarR family transcriptional regulator